MRDLGIFEPWFLILGLLLALAGHRFARTAPGRRCWTLLQQVEFAARGAPGTGPILAGPAYPRRAVGGTLQYTGRADFGYPAMPLPHYVNRWSMAWPDMPSQDAMH